MRLFTATLSHTSFAKITENGEKGDREATRCRRELLRRRIHISSPPTILFVLIPSIYVHVSVVAVVVSVACLVLLLNHYPLTFVPCIV